MNSGTFLGYPDNDLLCFERSIPFTQLRKKIIQKAVVELYMHILNKNIYFKL